MSNPMNAGNVVARTDRLTLERDGTMGGLRVASNGPMAEPAIACMGLTKAGTSVGKYSLLESTIPNPFQVFTDSQNVVYYSCSFGELGSAGHVTEVTMVRQQGVKARGDGDILRQPVTRAQDATLLSRHSSQRIASSGRGLL